MLYTCGCGSPPRPIEHSFCRVQGADDKIPEIDGSFEGRLICTWCRQEAVPVDNADSRSAELLEELETVWGTFRREGP